MKLAAEVSKRVSLVDARFTANENGFWVYVKVKAAPAASTFLHAGRGRTDSGT